MKFYTNIGPRREIKVIAFDLRNSTATIENCDGSTQDIKLKAIILEPEEEQPQQPNLTDQNQVQKVAVEILEFANTSPEKMSIVRSTINSLYNTQPRLRTVSDIESWLKVLVHDKAIEDLCFLQEQIEQEYINEQDDETE